MRDKYCIAPGYTERSVAPDYFEDNGDGLEWQPDVYAMARRTAQRLNSSAVVDIGAGSGDKLARIPGRRIALDYGSNLDLGRARHPQIDWRHYDIEADGRLPVSSAELAGALLICADVIEHLVRPEKLVGHLKMAFDDGAACCLVSTPDRVRTRGRDHGGPPPNPYHPRVDL